MKRSLQRTASALVLLVAAPSALEAQSNLRPGTDVSLGILGEIDEVGRVGSYPTGVEAVAMSTTSCNLGSVDVPWLAAMQEDHPMIAFLVARESDGRLVQISDRSYLKHGFFALSNSQCIPCQHPSNGSFLGVGCSDTYGIGNNGDNYWLGPPSEIDPWLGTWQARCSFFDVGLTNLPCDGNRSYSRAQAGSLDAAGFRVRIQHPDLDVPGASYYYAAHYVIQGEPEANRENNMGSRAMSVVQSGTGFNVATGAGVYLDGSILRRWTGATLSSNTNGGNDGRVYVAAKVTQVGGVYHYEYALHNRDNSGGINEIRIPICSSSTISNFGFHDIDQNPGNDWTMSVQGNQLVFQAPAGNALEWNTIYNIWFDSSSAPEQNGSADLFQERLAPGAAASFAVSVPTPGGNYNVDLGPGCGTPAAPYLVPKGNPPRGVPGNATFGFNYSQCASFATVVLVGSIHPGVTTLAPGCNLYMSLQPNEPMIVFGSQQAQFFGFGIFDLPVPNIGEVEGLILDFQLLELQPGTGQVFQTVDLSNAWRVHFGSNPNVCP